MSTFMPSKPSKPAESIALSKCLVFPTNALFFHFFKWSKMLMLKLLVEGTVMLISDMTPGHLGVTFGNEHTSTRTDGKRPQAVCRATNSAVDDSIAGFLGVTGIKVQ